MPSLKENGLKAEDLDQALLWAEDTLTRAQIPFLLLGDTLKSITQGDQVAGEKIELGVRERHLTYDTAGMLKIVEPHINIGEGLITFEKFGVPVEIKIIKKKWAVLENPELIFYRVSEYLVPNPVEKYLKMRYLIK